VPTKAELVSEIGAVLRQAGARYATAGTRDKHYGIWIFSLAFDEARGGRGAELENLVAGNQAVFRGKPSDLSSATRYTYARALGAMRDWEMHVDVNMWGTSGITHGVDVSVIPDKSVKEARTNGRQPKLSRYGLGIEAKCFSSRITPNEGRVALGFQLEMKSVFWLVATTSNPTVEAMLRAPRRTTAFFGDTSPGTPSEAELRRALIAHLNR
jgi:hypothetical protein